MQISSIRVSTHLDYDVRANMSGQYGDKWYVGVGCGSREVRRAVIAFRLGLSCFVGVLVMIFGCVLCVFACFRVFTERELNPTQC